jgi:protein-disulfide isomerase
MSTLKIPISTLDHQIGLVNAPVIIVEYFDFQCPYCALAAPVLDGIVEKFDSDVCFVARHFPLKTVHPFANPAALASEAAALQGKFWEMHHALFANQEFLNEDNIRVIAQELGLNMNKFTSDLARPELAAKVQSDFKGGIRSGVNGTPTIFINGYRYDGVPSYEELSAIAREIIGDENSLNS